MEKRIKPRMSLLFVTLPQTVLAVCLAWLLASKGSTPVMAMLIAVFAAGVVFTIFALLPQRGERVNKAAYMVMAVVYSCGAVASVPLLEGSMLFGFLSVRLLSMLLCALPVLFSLVALAGGEDERADAVRYVIGIAAVPLAFLILFNIISGANLETLTILLIVAAVYIAALLLIKALRLRNSKPLASADTPAKRPVALYAIFSLGLPLIGLFINLGMGNLVGDFSDPLFFIVAAVNGIILLAKPFADRRLRLFCFFLTAAATAYLVYFFIVFLPYIPIGFIGLVIILGVLMFAPAGALVMQIIYLVREWPQVARANSAKRALFVFIAGFMFLPVCMLTSFIGDKHNFDVAASYLESGTSVSEESVNLTRLRRALDNAGSEYAWSDDFLSPVTSHNTPVISAVYSKVVFGSTVVFDDNIEKMQKLFFNEYGIVTDEDGLTVNGDMTTVAITEIDTDTVYDTKIGAYRSWVNLTLQGQANVYNQEYVTVFSLPDGAYISDYYLTVSGQQKYGILADDRAATAVYEDIVRVDRDPGLIHYVGDNELELRVFPFNEEEARSTGFEIIHAFPVEFTLDGREVALKAPCAETKIAAEGGTLISAQLKAMLPRAQTRPLEYFFVVDCSAKSDIAYQTSLIEDYASLSGIAAGRVLFASYRLKEIDLTNIREADVKNECGFNLALAVKTILTKKKDDTIPVILFTSDNPYGAVYPEYIAALTAKYPEIDSYFRINDDLTLTPYDFETGEAAGIVASIPVVKALEWNGQRIADDRQSELVLSGETAPLTLSDSEYRNAVSIFAAYENPSQETDALKLLRASFRTHVLTPQTAFIVVENKAQEAELYEMQEQLLNGTTETARQTLAEPPVWILALVVIAACAALWLLMRVRKDAKRSGCE